MKRMYLFKLRKLKKLTQVEVAEYLGYIRESYQKIEYGEKSWSFREFTRILSRLSELYGVSEVTLFEAERDYLKMVDEQQKVARIL